MGVWREFCGVDTVRRLPSLCSCENRSPPENIVFVSPATDGEKTIHSSASDAGVWARGEARLCKAGSWNAGFLETAGFLAREGAWKAMLCACLWVVLELWISGAQCACMCVGRWACYPTKRSVPVYVSIGS